MKNYGIAILLSAALATGALAGCTSASGADAAASSGASVALVASETSQTAESGTSEASSTEAASTQSASAASADSAMSASAASASADSATSAGIFETKDLFTERDMAQEADLSNAEKITVESGKDLTISEEGVYLLSGKAEDVTITVEADEQAKVQLVLDGLEISNTDSAAIYVVSADKVFVTTAEGSTNKLTVSGDFVAVGEDNVDGVIFAKDDIVLNGKGNLTIDSSNNGIVGKDDVKITGGSYEITAANHAIQGKDSVAIADGSFTLKAGKDGIHAENADDQAYGYVYIAGGTFKIEASSDAIEGDAFVKIDGGELDINAAEGIEGTYVQINDGTVGIVASDDGINATSKSSAYDVVLEVNGGSVKVDMGSGDTDALDSNGDLIVNGGTVDITAQFAFDFVGQGQLNGGTVTVNGEKVTAIENSMMGPGGGVGGMGPQGSRGAQAPQDSQGSSAGSADANAGSGPRAGMPPSGGGPRGDGMGRRGPGGKPGSAPNSQDSQA